MRAILKSTQELGTVWQSERGTWWFSTTPYRDFSWRQVTRSEIVLIPEVE